MKLEDNKFKEEKEKGGGGECAQFFFFTLCNSPWNSLSHDVDTKKCLWFEKTSRQVHEKVIY